MLSAFREHSGKVSMKRIASFILIPLAYIAVCMGRDWQTVTAILGGAVVPLMKKDPAGNKDGDAK